MRAQRIFLLGLTTALFASAMVPVAVRADSAPQAVPQQEAFEQFGAAAKAAGTGQQNATLEQVIVRIIRATFSVIGIVVIGFLIYSGWIWTTAADSDRVDKAKTTIRNLVIGLIVLFLAYAIARFVVAQLLRATGNVM